MFIHGNWKSETGTKEDFFIWSPKFPQQEAKGRSNLAFDTLPSPE